MTIEEMEECFKKHEDDEYIEFDKIPDAEKRHKRPDLCAFLLLAELFPKDGSDMVCSAEHDEIWLDPEIGDDSPLTEEHIIYLLRCGVRWDDGASCFALFV